MKTGKIILLLIGLMLRSIAEGSGNENFIAPTIEHLQMENNLLGDHDLDEVGKYLQPYLQHASATEAMLTRSVYFFPTIDRILTEYGLPSEVKYITIIESTLEPTASSSVGAAGLWQLMPYTAKELGLKINSIVDERKHIEKSTRAAAEYIANLYEKFGDWNLTFAAYNAGPGAIYKAIRKSGSTKFDDCRMFLPRQTRQYIPKFLAVQLLYENQESLGLSPDLPNPDLLWTSEVCIRDQIQLSEMVDHLGVDKDVLQRLNPFLRLSYIPKSKTGIHILLPARVVPIQLSENTQSIVDWPAIPKTESNLAYQLYEVVINQDQSLQDFCKIHDMDTETIKSLNFLTGTKLITGQEIVVYQPVQDVQDSWLKEEVDPIVRPVYSIPTIIEKWEPGNQFMPALKSSEKEQQEIINWIIHTAVITI